MFSVAWWLLAAALATVATAYRAPTEEERVKLWHEAGNKWPPEWQPETDGMKRLMEFREKEIMAIPGADERWENWMQFTQSRMVPKFTPKGIPDIHLIKDGRYIALEIKKKGTYLSPDQRIFQKNVETAGGIYLCVRGIEDIEKLFS